MSGLLEGGIKSYLKRGAIGSLVLRVAALGLLFVSSIVMARILGKDAFGEFSYVFNWVLLFATMSTLGFADLLVKELPVLEKNDDDLGIATLRTTATIATVLVSIFSSSLFLLLSYFGITIALENSFPLLKIAMIAAPLFSLIVLWQADLRAHRSVITGQLPENIWRPALLLGAVVSAYLVSKTSVSLQAAVGFNVVAFVGALIVMIPALKKVKFKLRGIKIHRHWLLAVWPFFLLTLLELLNSRLDVVLLGHFGFVDEVGVYTVAARFAQFLLFVLSIMNLVAAPLYSRMYESGDTRGLQKLFATVSGISLICGLPLLVFFVLGGKWLLGIYGEGFDEGFTSLLILSGGQLAYVIMGPVAYVLMMCGKSRSVIIAQMIGVIVTIILELILIPRLGIEGAAWARSAGLIVWHGALSIVIIKQLKILPGMLGFFR